MTEKEYISKRVDSQIEWHNRKSICNKRLYLFCSWVLIVGSILTSVMIPLCQVVGVVLSILVAITASISRVYKFHSKWRLYRLTSEMLIHEKFLYDTQTGAYNNQNTAYSKLVGNVEAILMKTNDSWDKLLEDMTQKNEIKKQNSYGAFNVHK